MNQLGELPRTLSDELGRIAYTEVLGRRGRVWVSTVELSQPDSNGQSYETAIFKGERPSGPRDPNNYGIKLTRISGLDKIQLERARHLLGAIAQHEVAVSKAATVLKADPSVATTA